MEALSKKERYTFAGLLVNLLLHFILWSANEFEIRSSYADDFWPFDASFKRYEITEFLVYGIVPLAIFAIYYYVWGRRQYNILVLLDNTNSCPSILSGELKCCK